MRDTERVEQPVEQGSLTQRLTDEAVREIRESGRRPFFIYLAYPMPHLPLHASAAYRGRSRAGLYGDVIEELDASAGRIMDALREQGLDHNTLVVFASDNGPWLNYPDTYPALYGTEPSHSGSPGPLRGSKGTTYEGGIRVPGIVRWPAAIPGGRELADVVTTMDLFTTALLAAGAEVPRDRPVDGVDVLPLLRGEGAAPERPFFYFLANRLQGVRQGGWKLRLAGGAAGEPELFQLDVDPAERFNLAAAHPEVVARLRERMQQFGAEVGAAMQDERN